MTPERVALLIVLGSWLAIAVAWLTIPGLVDLVRAVLAGGS